MHGGQQVTAALASPCAAHALVRVPDVACARAVQLEEWLERPRGLPGLPRLAQDNGRLAREAKLAEALKLPGTRAAATVGTGPQDAIAEDEDAQLGDKLKWVCSTAHAAHLAHHAPLPAALDTSACDAMQSPC